MDQTLINILIGSAITLIGVLITSLINRNNLRIQLNHQFELEKMKLQHQAEREIQKKHFDKLETLHQSVFAYNDFLKITFSEISLLVNNKISADQYHQLVAKVLPPLTDIGHMIKLYSPELEESYLDLTVKVRKSLESGSKLDLNDQNAVKILVDLVGETRGQCTTLLKEIQTKCISHQFNKIQK